ncbi:hypothetical protein BAUCODRAFT_541029 [Baudoinia panamericana UAMH 10762]|uniref:Uncharacterized protein n=1 Tax=Baudoinia panamericana (strain UAMH 10762) TaxID=717646 RepID=M2LM84_BAUPA|nr:uncharacterized protein BAUCODRAFT_541029 [Baudoinia panamericana UAMH 10762]EMC95427.1 hypothetical protein BAUCODRAFT_541029 [Baudoinia panamericana UAMH 10762]
MFRMAGYTASRKLPLTRPRLTFVRRFLLDQVLGAPGARRSERVKIEALRPVVARSVKTYSAELFPGKAALRQHLADPKVQNLRRGNRASVSQFDRRPSATTRKKYRQAHGGKEQSEDEQLAGGKIGQRATKYYRAVLATGISDVGTVSTRECWRECKQRWTEICIEKNQEAEGDFGALMDEIGKLKCGGGKDRGDEDVDANNLVDDDDDDDDEGQMRSDESENDAGNKALQGKA